MSGMRDWLSLDEHSEQVRQRVAKWEHHEPAELPKAELAEEEFEELQELFEEMRTTEEELRDASR
ncbi:MAG TPA: hypothetical protein VG713_19130 [Pirellulales bacterium]|nr:hypothetical protein [Pirellulales bacterium]